MFTSIFFSTFEGFHQGFSSDNAFLLLRFSFFSNFLLKKTKNVSIEIHFSSFQGARIWLPDPERVWRAVVVSSNYDGKGKLEVTSNDGKKVSLLLSVRFLSQ